MIGCLLNTRDDRGYPFQNIIDMVWVALAGVTGFVLAILVHGAKLGFRRDPGSRHRPHIRRRLCGGSGAQYRPVRLDLVGDPHLSRRQRLHPDQEFRSSARSARRRRGGGFSRAGIWLVSRRGPQAASRALLRLARFARRAVILVHSCQGAFVCASTARFYPLACTDGADWRRDGCSCISQAFEARKAWAISFRRSFVTLAIPAVVLLTVALVASWTGESKVRNMGAGSACARHARFCRQDIGVDLRMSEKWFTLDYACDRASPTDMFFIRAINGEADRTTIFASGECRLVPCDRNCYYAQRGRRRGLAA